MSRSLTSPASTEAAKQHGAFPRWILEVQFASGTKYWAGEDLTSPVTADGRILNVGQLTVSGDPGRGASVGTLDIEVEDSDLFLLGENETAPGVQTVDAFLYIWFEGTTWPDDRITEFQGILTAPMKFNETTASWRITLKGVEHKLDKEIGMLATQDIFPEIRCAESENAIIPIVYGNPCRRVPMTVIDRPGTANLDSTLEIPDSSLSINATADEAGFTSGSSIDLIVGFPGRWERITGSFANGSATSFSITARGSVLAEGTIDGFYGSGGVQYVMIPQADLPNNNSRAGHFIFLKDQSAVWHAIMVSRWAEQGTNIIVVEKSGLDLASNADYKLGRTAGSVPLWNVGTPVMEDGTWTYLANFRPSKSIDKIEAPSEIDVPGGDRQKVWLEVNSAHYTVSTNDTSYNSALGRTSGDPGLTTVDVDFAPTQLGFDNDTLYATIKGNLDNDNPSTGTVLENPADVIEDLLSNEFLGNVPAANVNSSSFTTASGEISTKFSFAILDERKRLNELAGDLADQANSILFWDEGQATIKKLEAVLDAGDSVLTITKGEYSLEEALQVEEVDVKQFTSELSGRFRPAIPAPELRLSRESTGAKTDFGVKREEKQLWAYQFPTSVALSIEEWLDFMLENNRMVTFTTFLNALSLQPGDTITLDIDDGAGNVLFDSVLARVRSIRRTAGNARQQVMPRTQVACDVRLWSYTVSTAVPSDDLCAGTMASRVFEETGKLYLESSGTGRSLLISPISVGRVDGAALKSIANPTVDPTGDYVVSTGGDVGEHFPVRINPNDIGGGGGGIVHATLDAELTEGGSAAATTSGGDSITVHEVLGTGGSSIASGKNVACGYDVENEQWIVLGAEC